MTTEATTDGFGFGAALINKRQVNNRIVLIAVLLWVTDMARPSTIFANGVFTRNFNYTMRTLFKPSAILCRMICNGFGAITDINHGTGFGAGRADYYQ